MTGAVIILALAGILGGLAWLACDFWRWAEQRSQEPRQ
jgi:hypothetical protein